MSARKRQQMLRVVKLAKKHPSFANSVGVSACIKQKEGKQMLIECPANTRLQDYLLQNDIHILTACGGRGNCAKCVVRIIKGHATVNTMDQIWFSEEQLLAGYRLGCHVYAKEPLTVEIPN